MAKEKPFIHLLKSINGFYFYDTNKNQVIEISEDLYKYLANKLYGIEADFDYDKCKDEEEELIENGYLSTKKVKQLEHEDTKHMSTILDRCLENFILQVTQNCNFRCKYCTYTSNIDGQRLHSSKRMNFETAKKCVDYLLEHSIDSKKVNIAFYGGEPLLEFDLIKKVIEYSQKLFVGKQLTYSLTTNGSLLTDEITQFFQLHKVNLTVSFDGAKSIHDKNRVFANKSGSTYDAAYKALRNIYENYPDYFKSVSVNMVIDPSVGCKETYELFDTDPMLKEIILRSTIVNDKSIEKNVISNEFAETNSYNRFLKMISELTENKNIKYSKVLNDKYIKTDVLDHMIEQYSLPDKCIPSGPCVIGKTKLFVNTDGCFYPCEKVSETCNDMIIGNIDDGIDVKRAAKLMNLSQLRGDKCKNCWAFRLCNVCPSFIDDGQNISLDVINENCQNSIYNAHIILLDYIMYKEYSYNE